MVGLQVCFEPFNVAIDVSSEMADAVFRLSRKGLAGAEAEQPRGKIDSAINGQRKRSLQSRIDLNQICFAAGRDFEFNHRDSVPVKR